MPERKILQSFYTWTNVCGVPIVNQTISSRSEGEITFLAEVALWREKLLPRAQIGASLGRTKQFENSWKIVEK